MHADLDHFMQSRLPVLFVRPVLLLPKASNRTQCVYLDVVLLIFVLSIELRKELCFQRSEAPYWVSRSALQGITLQVMIQSAVEKALG